MARETAEWAIVRLDVFQPYCLVCGEPVDGGVALVRYGPRPADWRHPHLLWICDPCTVALRRALGPAVPGERQPRAGG